MATTDELFREIEHLTDIIQNEERQGEQRVQFFLTLAVGSIGLFAYLQKGGALEYFDSRLVSLAVLTILLLYGLHTLNRLIWRNVYLKSSHIRMRSAYLKLSEIDKHYKEALDLIDAIDNRPNILRRVRGSTSEFMYMTNALLLGGIVLSLGLYFSWPVPCISTLSLLTIILGIIIQYQFSHHYSDQILRNRK